MAREIPVATFVARSNEDLKLLEIAQFLGETDMRFLLSCSHRKYGLHAMETIYEEMKNITRTNPGKIRDKKRYFNKSVRNEMETLIIRETPQKSWRDSMNY